MAACSTTTSGVFALLSPLRNVVASTSSRLTLATSAGSSRHVETRALESINATPPRPRPVPLRSQRSQQSSRPSCCLAAWRINTRITSRANFSTTSTQRTIPTSHDLPDHIAELRLSRRDLMRWWHEAARDTTMADVQWEGRDHLQANCTVINADGSIERVAELSKADMIQEFGIQPRDLRSLDAHILDVRPALLVCKRSIILCTPINRAIISHNKLVMVGSDPKNPLVTPEQAIQMAEAIKHVMQFLFQVAQVDSANGSKRTFEFRALEAMLLLTVRGFKILVSDLQARVYSTIPQLRFGVSPDELRHLLESKRIVEDCLFSGRAMQQALATVLSEDEDLLAMYLTDKANGVQRPIQDHQNAELLLEYYERRLDETNESSERLSSLLSDLDSNLSLTLASTRVRLQNLELQTAITTLALAAGTALAGFFGMNLVSGYEESPTAFYWATTAGVGSMVIIMCIGYIRLFRARRSQLFMGSVMQERREVLRRHDDRAAIQSSSSSTGTTPALAKLARQETPSTMSSRKVDAELDKHKAQEKKKDGTEI